MKLSQHLLSISLILILQQQVNDGRVHMTCVNIPIHSDTSHKVMEDVVALYCFFSLNTILNRVNIPLPRFYHYFSVYLKGLMLTVTLNALAILSSRLFSAASCGLGLRTTIPYWTKKLC